MCLLLLNPFYIKICSSRPLIISPFKIKSLQASVKVFLSHTALFFCHQCYHGLNSTCTMNSFATALCFFCVAYTAAQTLPPRYNDVLAALASTRQFTVFSDLLTKSGLLPIVNSSLHFTVFAPTDNAFARLPAADFEAIKNDPAKLADVIGTHLVLTSNVHVGNVQQDVRLSSYNHHQIRLNTYNIVHTVTADGVNITIRNIPVLHGTVHGLDGILVPPTTSTAQISFNRADLSNFTSLLVSANLLNFYTADQDVTLFLPNNDAFKSLSPGVLAYLQSHPADLAETIKYHIVRTATIFSLGLKHSITLTSADNNRDQLMVLEDDAGGVSINTAKIVQKDIIATDGVIHIINKVLLPPRVLVHIADSGIVVG
ncbi:unnamed protein product [Lymnaea stagnalis]|uniref:FAS1 domain-containing protein n=1 Tax=Lymnaea stagnalis TaxID=6523 RepID=A0AAV2H0F8_LYMST